MVPLISQDRNEIWNTEDFVILVFNQLGLVDD